MTRIKLWALVFVVVLVLPKSSFAQGLSPSQSPLKGTVKSSDGKPLEGVAVSARANGKTVTTTVYSDQDGRYLFPPLAPPQEEGQYSVWAQAVEFEADRSSVKLSAGHAMQQDFVLKPLKDFTNQLAGVEWMESLPESTPEDKRIKRIFGANCINCHQTGFLLQNRFDARGWTALVNFMVRGGDSAQATGLENGFIGGYESEIVSYLARVRGPDPASFAYKPRPRVTGEAAQIVVTEYDVSPGHLPGYLVIENGSDWSLGTPSRVESGATHDLVWDPRGYVWFPDNLTPGRTIGKLDPKTGRVTDYNDLSSKEVSVNSHDIYVDHLGNVWVNNGKDESMDKFDPKTEKFQRFPRPESVPPGIGRLFDEDSKGNIWQGIQGRPIILTDPESKLRYETADPQQPGGTVKLNPKTGEYTFYKALTPALTTYGVSVDADDNVWFTRTGRDLVGMLDTHSGKVIELNLSARDKDDIVHTPLDDELAAKFEPVDEQGPPWQKGPRRQASDRKNGTQWIAFSKSSALAKIDIHTRKVTEYPLPYRYSFPYSLTVDKNHMVWVAALNTDSFFKFNPFTEQFTEYRLPTHGTDTRSVSVDNSTDPPTVWLAYWQTSKLARIQFRATTPDRASGR